MHETRRWKVCSRCRQIKRKTARNFQRRRRNAGGYDEWCKDCRNAYQSRYARQRRRERNARWHLDFEIKAHLRRVVGVRRAAGDQVNDIAGDLGISDWAVRYLMPAQGQTVERGLIYLHVEQGLSPAALAGLPPILRGGYSAASIRRLLVKAGVFRPSSRKKGAVSSTDVGGDLLRAAAGRKPVDSLGAKQSDILNIVRVAPSPLKTAQVSAVAMLMKRSGGWSGWDVMGCGSTLSLLAAKGLIVETTAPRSNGDSRPAKAWYATDPAICLGVEDAAQTIQLRRLIEEQEADDRERVKGTGSVSLDAPLTEDGFTILDALGSEDEALAELLGQAA